MAIQPLNGCRYATPSYPPLALNPPAMGETSARRVVLDQVADLQWQGREYYRAS